MAKTFGIKKTLYTSMTAIALLGAGAVTTGTTLFSAPNTVHAEENNTADDPTTYVKGSDGWYYETKELADSGDTDARLAKITVTVKKDGAVTSTWTEYTQAVKGILHRGVSIPDNYELASASPAGFTMDSTGGVVGEITQPTISITINLQKHDTSEDPKGNDGGTEVSWGDDGTEDPSTGTEAGRAEGYVDKTALQAAFDKYEYIDAGYGYTTASLNAFDDALYAAADVLFDPTMTQDQVDTALEELEAAVAGLVKGPEDAGEADPDTGDSDEWVPDKPFDDSALQSLFDEYQPLEPSGYTKASYDILQETLFYALDALTDPETTQGKVDQALGMLQRAVAGLVKGSYSDATANAPKGTVDKSALRREYMKSKILNVSGYTQRSSEVLGAISETAGSLIWDPDATQAEVDAKLAELKAAFAGLVTLEENEAYQGVRADKDALQSVYDKYIDQNLDAYDPERAGALTYQLIRTGEILEDNAATQEDVDAQLAALQNAVDALTDPSSEPVDPGSDVTDADKTELQALYDEAYNLDVTPYAIDTIDELNYALENALDVLNDDYASQESVDEQVEILQTAVDGLVKEEPTTTDPVGDPDDGKGEVAKPTTDPVGGPDDGKGEVTAPISGSEDGKGNATSEPDIEPVADTESGKTADVKTDGKTSDSATKNTVEVKATTDTKNGTRATPAKAATPLSWVAAKKSAKAHLPQTGNATSNLSVVGVITLALVSLLGISYKKVRN